MQPVYELICKVQQYISTYSQETFKYFRFKGPKMWTSVCLDMIFCKVTNYRLFFLLI